MIYMLKWSIPKVNKTFEINLFNTFRCYMEIKSHYPVPFIMILMKEELLSKTIKSILADRFPFQQQSPA